MQHSMARTISLPRAGIIDDIEREDDAEGYEDAAFTSALRSLRTPDLYRLRADSAIECLQPLQQSATSAAREQLCAQCPLTRVCDAIRDRENAAGVYTDTESPAPAAATVPIVELADRRPRGIRAAVTWEAA